MNHSTSSARTELALSKLQHWSYLHEQSSYAPYELDAELDFALCVEEARNFTFKSVDQALLVDGLMQEVFQGLPAANIRRNWEQKLASFIKHDVLPYMERHYPDRRDELEGVAEKMVKCRMCGLVGVVAGTHQIKKWEHKCGQAKSCPDEARVEGQRLAAHYIPHVLDQTQGRNYQAQYAVMTTPNVPLGQLKHGKSLQWKAWKRYRLRKVDIFGKMVKVKDILEGSLVTQEDPLSCRIDTETGEAFYSWNVHLNVLSVCKGHVPWGQLREVWTDCFNAVNDGDDVEGCDIEFQSEKDMTKKAYGSLNKRGEIKKGDFVTRLQVLTRAFAELVKYTTKIAGGDEKHVQRLLCDGTIKQHQPTLTDYPVEAFAEWWVVNRGARRTRGYGTLYNAPDVETEKLDMTDVEWIGVLSFAKGKYELQLPEGLRKDPAKPGPIGLVPDHKFTSGVGSQIAAPQPCYNPPYSAPQHNRSGPPLPG